MSGTPRSTSSFLDTTLSLLTAGSKFALLEIDPACEDVSWARVGVFPPRIFGTEVRAGILTLGAEPETPLTVELVFVLHPGPGSSDCRAADGDSPGKRVASAGRLLMKTRRHGTIGAPG
jgi:hypothetical protein